jgi:hypothetical protein
MKAITPETLKALGERLPVRFCLKRGTYKEWLQTDLIPLDGELILVTELPWHKSWFGLKPTRLKVGDGKTPFRKLKFL